jgi:hypothetical protein
MGSGHSKKRNHSVAGDYRSYRSKFTNTITETFSENENYKYATVFLILVVMGLILYCMLNTKNV